MSNVYLQDFQRGLIREIPIFRLLLGMCPVLAVTTYLTNGIGMGLAATAVLICSNLVISALRNYFPAQVRIPCFIVVIATFVTMVDMVMEAFVPALYERLGIFIPLIVVNCIILGRAEAFAGKRPVLRSLVDGLGNGLGFIVALIILALVRETIGAGTILGPDPETAIKLFGDSYQPMLIFALPPGAFIALGLLLGMVNYIYNRLNIK